MNSKEHNLAVIKINTQGSDSTHNKLTTYWERKKCMILYGIKKQETYFIQNDDE
jgi:hypothetical protein